MRKALGIGFMLVGVGLSGSATQAWAQADVGRADQLFKEGRELLGQKKFDDACPKLAEAYKIAPGIGGALYLADCYENQRRTASAYTTFREAQHMAEARRDARGDVARRRAESLIHSVPSVFVRVDPPAQLDGLEVTADGRVDA